MEIPKPGSGKRIFNRKCFYYDKKGHIRAYYKAEARDKVANIDIEDRKPRRLPSISLLSTFGGNRGLLPKVINKSSWIVLEVDVPVVEQVLLAEEAL